MMGLHTSSILGPGPLDAGPSPGAAPVGMPPGMPPAPWYILVMMGLHTPSSSFICGEDNRTMPLSTDQRTAATPHALRPPTRPSVNHHHHHNSRPLRPTHLVLELLLLRELVGVDPLDRLLHGVLDGLLVLRRRRRGHLLVLDRVAHRVGVVLERVLRLDLVLVALVLGLVLLGLLHHALDVVLAQAALVVGDRDLVHLARRLVLRRHVEDAVGVNVERHRDLGHAAGRG